MKPFVILYREGIGDDEEFAVMQKHFEIAKYRTQIHDKLVIGRYSVLLCGKLYYKELEQDLAFNQSELINSYRQHRYIADLGNWYRDLQDVTPETWNYIENIPAGTGPLVVKGETNSKKFNWKTHMFANNRNEAVAVMCRLQEDGFLCDQHIYFRRYVPLVKLMDGLGGLDVTKEFRFFVCDGQILSGGFYWSNYQEDLGDKIPSPDEVPREFLQHVIDAVGANARFYVIDVAQTQEGKWIVIELNDGQMSGLSMNDPNTLYENLYKVLNNET